jgi:hypothetical protein
MDEQTIFAVSVVPLTLDDEQRETIQLKRGAARLIALKEILLIDVVLKHYKQLGLADVSCLRKAILETESTLNITASFSAKIFIVPKKSAFVCLAVAEKENVFTKVTDHAFAQQLKNRYKEIKIGLLETLIEKRKYAETLPHFSDLQKAALMDNRLVLELLYCLVQMKNINDVQNVVNHLLKQSNQEISFYWQLVSVVPDHGEFEKIHRQIRLHIEQQTIEK